MDDVFEILGEQAISGGLFGEIAVRLGHLDKGELHQLLELQATQVPTLMDALMALSIITSKQADELHHALHQRGSRLLGLDRIGTLAHSREEVLSRMRNRDIVPSSELVTTILRAADTMKGLIDAVETYNESMSANMLR